MMAAAIQAVRRRMVHVEDAQGCHVWQRARNNRGYGVIWFDGKLRLAHRVAWFLEHGAWPRPGLVVDHICENKACVNPAHLRELTSGANIQRAYPRGDAATETRRAQWRAASARLRAKRRASSGMV